MRPILFEIFNISFASWYVFFALAALAGYGLVLFLAQKTKQPLLIHSLPMLFISSYLGAWFGARLLSILTEEPPLHSIPDLLTRLFSLGGMTFFGGLLGGFLAGIIYVRARRLPLWPLLDVVAPGILLALSFGRIGCFLNGCDYGRPFTSAAENNPWWAPAMRALEDGLPRYPVQLEESLFSLLLAALGATLLLTHRPHRWSRHPGTTGLALLSTLCFHRFLNEFFRNEEPIPGWPFTLFQSYALTLAAVTFFLALWRCNTRATSHHL